MSNINIKRRLLDSMMDVIQVDEKCFFMKEQTSTFFLVNGQEEPHWTCKSKRFIGKVMFLAAVARPRHDTSRNRFFDGKLGIWPFIHMVPARRNSWNCPAGTLEMKPIESINQEVYPQFICDKLMPAIKEKWPLCHRSLPIKIQQDNARPHLIPENDPQLAATIAATELDISLINQPPNSPDMNVLDLGYFNAIQSLEQTKLTDTVPQLVQAVVDSFAELTSTKLNYVFLTHQQCLERTILCDRGNNYKLPHMNKARLAGQGQLPVSIAVTDELQEKIKLLQEDEVQQDEVQEVQE